MPNHKMNNVSSADVTHNRAEQSTNEQKRTNATIIELHQFNS
jgi:hypothetical protein